MKRRILLVMLIGLFPCIVFAGHLYAAERTYNVLFIQSYTHRTPWNERLTEGVRDGLSRGGIKAKVTTEYLDADYWTFASECVIMRRICERARQKNTDIIITSSDEAFYTLMVRPYRRYNKCSIGKLLGKCSNIYLSSPAYLPTKGRQGV